MPNNPTIPAVLEVSGRIKALSSAPWLSPGAESFVHGFVSSKFYALDCVHLLEAWQRKPDRHHVYIYGKTPLRGYVKFDGFAPSDDKTLLPICKISLRLCDLEAVLYKRNQAKLDKDWQKADKFRRYLRHKKIELSDGVDNDLVWWVVNH